MFSCPVTSGTLSATSIPSSSSPHRITHHSPPMALVSSASLPTLPQYQRTPPLVASKSIPLRILSPRTTDPEQRRLTLASPSKWRTQVSFFPSFIKKRGKSREELKEELLGAIAPLDRGAEATPEDQERVDQIARQLEEVYSIKEPLKSELLNGKWELLYTTSRSILQPQRPKLLRPNGKIYQAINADTLRAQNLETWPYFNQVTANLEPLSARRVAVGFDTFKILGLIPIKAPARARGELEITYLDEELRVSRGDKGNLFILKMVDPSYRVPLQ